MIEASWTSRSTSRAVIAATLGTSKPRNAFRNVSRFPEHGRPAQPDLEHAEGERLEQRGLVVGPGTPDLVVVPAEAGISDAGPDAPWLPVIPDDHVAAHTWFLLVGCDDARPVRASPPLAFESTRGAAGAVERVEFRHVRVGEREVEDLRVLRDPVAVRRLRDRRDVALDAPAEQHLGRRAPEALRDPCRCFTAEVATVSERTVSLENDPVRTTRLEEPLPVLVRTELHLVDDRRDARRCEHLLEFGDLEVGNPDRACVPKLSSSL